MKKRILLLTILLLGLCGCKYDDGPILDKVNGLEGRVSQLDVACGKLNQDLVALQKVVTLLQDDDYVTSVTPLMDQGQQVGYTLTFAKGGPVSIRDGMNGLNGKDGTNGTNGKDGHTPALGVKADSDDIYYWTIDGEWLLTANGQKVRAEGNTPQLKIENEYWYVSSDNGINWQKMGRAVSANYTSPIKRVKVEDDRILLTLASGEEVAVPRISPSALRIEAPDSMEIDFRITYSFTIDYRIINATAPTLLRVETSNGLSAALQEESGGLSGQIVVDVSPTEVAKGLLVLKVCDANSKEAVKVVKLTQKAIEPVDTENNESTPIVFRDLKAKERLVKHYDIDGDGEISYTEASRLTFLPEQLFSYTTIKSFDELQYFTSLERIGDSAFRGCMCLTSVVIPRGVKLIDRLVFRGCKNLTQIVIPEGVKFIGGGAFDSCESLRSIVIPEGVERIEGGAFMRCESLRNIVIPEGVERIEADTFRECISLTHIVIPEGVTFIGLRAFEGCKSLKYIKLPSTLRLRDLYYIGLTPSTTIIVPKGEAESYGRFFSAGFKIIEE